MTLKQLLKHYGRQADIVKALGVERAVVSAWFTRGHIPETRQYQIELWTGGQLKADTRPLAHDGARTKKAVDAARSARFGRADTSRG